MRYLNVLKIDIMKGRLLVFFFIVGCALCSCGGYKTLSDVPSCYATMSDGTKIHYKTCGEGNITLVFVHGFGCDMNVWEKQYEDFKEDTIRMIFIDLPGYGKSDKPEVEYTLDYFANAVKTVIDSVHVTKVVLVGHSLGTPVCRQFVFAYPVNAVALCDIDGVYCFYPSNGRDLARYQNEINQFVESFRGEHYKDNMAAFVDNLQGPFTPEWIINYADSMIVSTPEYVAYSTMSNLVDPTYWTGEKINIPTLIICTRISDIPDDNKLLMDELYNDDSYIELDNTGHFIMMEDAGIVNNLIERCYERWRMTEL